MRDTVAKIVTQEGFELVDFVLRGNQSTTVIQLFVDRENGVTIDDCACLSRRIGDFLDFELEDVDFGSYRLEVSSPGIERPLKQERDFRRNVGRDVSVSFLSENGEKKIEGTILATDTDSVYLRVQRDTVRVPLPAIQKARIKVKW